MNKNSNVQLLDLETRDNIGFADIAIHR